MYDNLECKVNPWTGSGDIIVSHDFSGSHVNATKDDNGGIDVSLTYLVLSTNDELQSVIGQSESCKQAVTISHAECLDQMMWTSLNEDKWMPPAICNGYAIKMDLYYPDYFHTHID